MLDIEIHVEGKKDLEEIKTDMKALRTTTAGVQKDIDSLTSAIKELGETLNKASPKRHTKAQKELAKQTKDTTNAILKETKDAKNLAKASEETAKSKEKAARASKKQADAEEKVAKQARKAKKEVTGLAAVMKRIGDVNVPVLGMQLKDLNNKFATLFTTITNLQKKLDSFRVASTFGFIGALVAGVSGVALGGVWRREAISTETRQGAYANGGYVGVITDKIVEAAQELGQKFKQVDPTQIANAISAMMHPRLGYDIDEAKNLTSLILKITGATGTDAGYLAPVIRTILTEYNIKPSDAETSLVHIFDVARKTGKSILDVAHYMADMAGVARRTGTGFAEMLTRGGQAWYADADASTVYGAIYREAHAMTKEYEDRYRDSLNTLRTSDTMNREFKQAWYNLFQGEFPGLDKPGVLDFLRELRTKQLWTHDIDSLVLEFASRQGYGFDKLYRGDTTYRGQVDTLMADVFTKPNASILSRFSDEERDAFNVMRDALPQSTEALSHVDLNVDDIAHMQKDTRSTWDRMVEGIKEFFTPLIHFVEGIFRFFVPKESREDIMRERLAEENGVPYDKRNPWKLNMTYGLTPEHPWTISEIESFKKKYPNGTVTFTDLSHDPDFWVRLRNPYPFYTFDPLGKLMSSAQEETLASIAAPTTSTPVKGVPPLGNNSTGTQTVVNNNTFNITGNINSLSEMQRGAEIASRTTAYQTGW